MLKNLKHSSLNNNQTYKLLRRSSFNIFCWCFFLCVSGKQLNNLKIFNFTMVKKRLKESSAGSLLFLHEQFFLLLHKFYFTIYCYYFASVFVDFFQYVLLCCFRVFFCLFFFTKAVMFLFFSLLRFLFDK